MIKFEKLSYPVLVGGHVALTFFIIALPVLVKVFFYAVVGYFFIQILTNADRNREVLVSSAYLCCLEVFLRMNDALPFYEMIKYLIIIFSLTGILLNGFSLKSTPFAFYLLLLVPSIVIAAQNIPLGESLRKSVAFNLSGPVALGIAAIYCYRKSITMQRLDELLKLAVGPIIMTTVYLIVVTPDIQEVVTDTSSNFATSGGYGPNQVATALGIGMFICFIRFLRIRHIPTNVLDMVLFIAMTYRGWVTFSRGGIFTAFIMILAVIGTLFFLKRSTFRISFIPKLVVIGIAIVLAWGYTSLATNGLIDKRYANQDAAGRAKKDLSTGRVELFTVELQAFLENPLLGIGAGQVKYYRAQRDGVIAASHNETSRLLSEHGFVGVLSLLLLIIAPLLYRLNHKGNLYFYAFLFFWLATINHSAMRIAAPSFFYGLALLYVVPAKARKKKRFTSFLIDEPVNHKNEVAIIKPIT